MVLLFILLNIYIYLFFCFIKPKCLPNYHIQLISNTTAFMTCSHKDYLNLSGSFFNKDQLQTVKTRSYDT